MMRKLAAGNWKMNGTLADLDQLHLLEQEFKDSSVDILICPPATLIHAANSATQTISIGAQNCHAQAKGANTGEISAPQIADLGARYVIIGHSERRQDQNETDAEVNAKAKAAYDAGLIAVICIGETLDQRDAGETLDVLGRQLAGSVPATANSENTVIAYEPVWAIGTGLVPTTEQIAQAHEFMRTTLLVSHGSTGQDMRLLYGGSVKGSNANDIFAVANVDGALVGGASLTAADFGPIITALEQA
jgi:triosephosphate isomerase